MIESIDIELATREQRMKIHYFQRYHSKENVATANTMLLLSRLYSYSPDKFFGMLKSEYFSDAFEPEVEFKLQEKSEESVPDATIAQDSFKIVVETKMTDWFHSDQLLNHLKSFAEERYKVLLTLSTVPMADNKAEALDAELKKYNQGKKHPVLHVNTTFEALAQGVQDVLDDRDHEMQEVLDDYLNYCYNDKLIAGSDAWKFLRVQLAGRTIDFNIKNNVYYDNPDRGFRAHDYLGLYSNKSVRAIGRVVARIVAVETDGEMEYEIEFGELTPERENTIECAIEDGNAHGYELRTNPHRYFFVDNFVEMDYRKSTPRAPMGTRIFDLSESLGITQASEMPGTADIARMLSDMTWS